MRAFLTFIAASLLLAACGTKGPLTLPPKPTPTDASTKEGAGR